MTPRETIVVTGATGHLGRLVLAELSKAAPTARLVGLARTPDRAADLAAQGAEIRKADYDRPDTLAAALAGADKVLLVSSNEMGRRLSQHQHVIAAATAAGVKLLAYTSILRADTSTLNLAAEHLATEQAIRGSGLPFVFLRNGWYTENYTANLASVVQHGAVFGAARDGRIAMAPRADYAAAAAAVMAGGSAGHAGQIYELAGDRGYTLAEYAAEISRQLGRTIPYRDLPEADYRAALVLAGLPEPYAVLIAESDAKAAAGALFDDSGTLRRLIGRPTTPLASSVAAALATLETATR